MLVTSHAYYSLRGGREEGERGGREKEGGERGGGGGERERGRGERGRGGGRERERILQLLYIITLILQITTIPESCLFHLYFQSTNNPSSIGSSSFIAFHEVTLCLLSLRKIPHIVIHLYVNAIHDIHVRMS